MSASFTLAILDSESLNQAPAHESAHPTIAAATTALEATLRDSEAGDRSVAHPTEWSQERPVFNLIDAHGKRVGVAVIESN